MNSAKNISVLLSMCTVALAGSLGFSDIGSDNSKMNQIDQDTNGITAEQQGANAVDVSITRQIRQELMQNKALSTYAQNIKIITVDGRVTLKGPVRSQSEEEIVLKCARSANGVSEVNSQLEIAKAN